MRSEKKLWKCVEIPLKQICFKITVKMRHLRFHCNHANQLLFQSVASERKEKVFLEGKTTTTKHTQGNRELVCHMQKRKPTYLNVPIILKMQGVSRSEKMFTVP